MLFKVQTVNFLTGKINRIFFLNIEGGMAVNLIGFYNVISKLTYKLTKVNRIM